MQLSGNILDYFVTFSAGVLVSFTPCVYPLLPITASIIAGANTKGTKLNALFLSMAYVFGIAVTYSFLAVVAALSGKIFGQLQNNAIVYFFVSVFLIIFGLSMFDIIKLPMIQLSQQRKLKPQNLIAILFFGMASGLVIGPCTAPVLGTLLIYIGSKQNVLRGMSLTFVFAYGVGASLILVGTFSSMLANMPKSGPWLKRIKQLCGIVLIFTAGYFFLQGLSRLISS